MRCLLACFIFLVVAGEIGCTKRITSNTIDGNSRVETYLAGGGGDLTWTSTGPSFKIHFLGDSPCSGKDLSAKAGGTATCRVAKDMRGTFAYQVLLTSPTPPQAVEKPTVYPCRITPCNNCPAITPVRTANPSLPGEGASSGPQDDVYCEGGKLQIYEDPLVVASGSTAQWLALGMGDTAVTIAFSESNVCAGGNPARGGTVNCKVQAGRGDHKYTATLAGCGASQEFTLRVQ